MADGRRPRRQVAEQPLQGLAMEEAALLLLVAAFHVYVSQTASVETKPCGSSKLRAVGVLVLSDGPCTGLQVRTPVSLWATQRAEPRPLCLLISY